MLGALRPSHAPSRACPPAASLVLSDKGDWLAASKPAGITVHEGSDSLLAALRADGCGELLPVHRLDRETSGVLLLAKRPEAAAALQAALAETAVKQYRGVLVGVPPARRGRWAGALSNRAEGRRNPRGVAAERVSAETAYSLVSDNGFLASADLTLAVGGRTHQIRKHAASAGSPIFGDRRYGNPRRNAQLQERYGFDGMALHASLLRLVVDGVTFEFEAPLPASWSALAVDGI
mmetsp:Transcript_20929/g.66832  ORF Transcript_20929/g.66832 Transcript_20929/m.66832 type:complete len:235 (-) Transcript_20929:229-933(-)